MVKMARSSKSKGNAAAGKVDDFKKRLDQLWGIGIGAPDAIEVITNSLGIAFYHWPARKKTLLSISTSRTLARDR